MPLTTRTLTLVVKQQDAAAPIDGTWTPAFANVNGIAKEPGVGILGGQKAVKSVYGVTTLELPVSAELDPPTTRHVLHFRSHLLKAGTKQPMLAFSTPAFLLEDDMNLDDIMDVEDIPFEPWMVTQVAEALAAVHAYRDEVVAVGNTNDTIIAGRVADPASVTAAAIEDKAPTQWQAKAIHVGERVERFMLRSADDGDMTSELTAFFADPAIKGKRKVVGRALVYDTPSMPGGKWVDMSQGVIQVMAASKRALNVTGPDSILEGGRFIGFRTDYVPSEGSAGAQKHGIGLVSANRFRGEAQTFEDFAESAVYFTTTSNATFDDLTVFGVHGRPAAPADAGQPWVDGSGNIVIPDNDARCRAFTGNNGCFNNTFRNLYVERASIGGTTGVNTEGWSVDWATLIDIVGQHGLYMQTPTRLRIGFVLGKGIARNVVKVQMAKSAIADRYGFVIGKIVAEDADCGLMLANTANDLSSATPWAALTTVAEDTLVTNGGHYYIADVAGTTGNAGGPTSTVVGAPIVDGTVTWYYVEPATRFMHAGSVESVVAKNCKKLAHISSVKGGSIGKLVGNGILKEAVTLQNNEDLDVESIVVDGTGWTGVYWRGGLGGANKRVTLRSARIRNPNDTLGVNPTPYITGMYSSDDLAEDIVWRDIDLSDVNGHMNFGAYFTTAVCDSATAIPTMKVEGYKVRGALTADIRFNTKPSSIKKFGGYDPELAPINMPPAAQGGTKSTQFTASGADQEYVIPPGATALKLSLAGASGGAGSGRRGAGGTVRCGGGGGGGGAFSEWLVPISSLPAGTTKLYVTVGAKGVGGAAVTADSTDGNSGTNGGSTYITTSSGGSTLANTIARANGGNAGSGGTATTGAAGAQQSSGRFFGGIGGAASTTGGAGNTPAAISSGGPGGGSGGGLTTGNATSNGGSGGAIGGRFTSSNTGGVAPGGAGNNGGESPQLGYGQGGSGGASNTGAAAGAGGNGGKGAGGGGGGASENGFNSGKGGDGGDGFAEIIAIF
jgi:hypothetical protein